MVAICNKFLPKKVVGKNGCCNTGIFESLIGSKYVLCRPGASVKGLVVSTAAGL